MANLGGLAASAVWVLGLVCPGIAHATPPPPVLLVKIDDGCANAATQAQFVKELKVRLPEKTSYIAQEDPKKPYWTLYWNQAPDQSCRVTLSDIQSVMALPLVNNAEPSQIRDVLVRLVWVMSTTSPKTPPKKEEVPPKPKEAPKKEIEPKIKETPPKDIDPPGDVIKQPEPTNRSTKKTSTNDSTIVGDMAAVLNSFRANAPGLFGDVAANTNAMPTSLLGVRTSIGFHAAVTTKATVIQEQPAWMGGLHVGMFIGRHFSLGASYHTLISDLHYNEKRDDVVIPGASEAENETINARRELNLNVAALDAEYMFFPEHPLQLSLSGSFGVGMAGWEARYRDGRADNKEGQHLFVMIDLNATLYYDMTDWLQLGFGFGWRDLNGLNFHEIGPGNMSGPTGNMTLRIGFF